MPQAFDNAWSSIGGGPADLSFPDTFLGVWLTESTLTKVETPLGLEYVPNPQNVQRALREDLKNKIRYEVAYVKNGKGQVVIDRRHNVKSLMNLYMGRDAISDARISWNQDDPNKMAVRLPGILAIQRIAIQTLLRTSSLHLSNFVAGDKGRSLTNKDIDLRNCAWIVTLVRVGN